MQHNPYSAPAAAGPNVAPGGGLSTGSYEFNEYENATIAKMGARAWWWGLISAITGVIGLLMLGGVMAFLDELAAEGIEPHYVTLFVGALGPVVLTHMVIAFNYMGAGSSLKAVVNTQGNDVEHLMQSLRKLGTAFMVEFIVGIIAIAIGVGAGIYLESMDIDVSSSDDFDFSDFE